MSMFTDQQTIAIEQGVTNLTEAAQLLERIRGGVPQGSAALWAEIDRAAGDCRFAADVLARELAKDWGDESGVGIGELDPEARQDFAPIDTEGT